MKYNIFKIYIVCIKIEYLHFFYVISTKFYCEYIRFKVYRTGLQERGGGG